MIGRRGARGGAVAALAMLLSAGTAHAVDAAEAKGKADLAIRGAEAEVPSIEAAIAKAKRVTETPEKRIVAGELLLRSGDYDRAIYVLCQVLELHRRGKVPETSYADALYLTGEAYFKDEQHLTAARHYKDIVEKGMQTPFDAYVGRALSRLVDVSIRTQHGEVLDYVFQKLAQLPATDAAGSLQYARGKAYLARGDLSSSRTALEAVNRNGDFTHQAGYLLGVVTMKEAMAKPPPAATEVQTKGGPGAAAERFAGAIEQFHKVTQLPADTDAHRHVIDLSWMAIGRLFYETENYLDAAEAYSHVDRASPSFGDMLYELAWVYVRLGDNKRAQRALEVLSVTSPESLHMADGSLLRADLMLRSGMFDRALELYEGVRHEFDPMRTKVISFMETTTDPTIYYDRLVEEDALSEQRGDLPRTVLKWVREAAEDDRVFTVIDDVTRSRDLLKKSKDLVRKLTAVLQSPTRVRAFPELKAGLERTLGLLNKVSLARKSLAQGLDSISDAPGSGEFGRVHAERRSLMKRLGWLPVTEGDFIQREGAAERQWNGVSQKLQGLTIEADRLQAMVNALHSVLDRNAREGGGDPASRERFKAELESNERELKTFRDRITAYRDAIEIGRVQVGFGDQRYVEDAEVRARFKEAFTREVQLDAAGQGDPDTTEYARTLQGSLAKADAVEATLDGIRRGLEDKIASGVQDIQKEVDAEAENLRAYAGQLEELDQSARVLVGEAAMRNFGLVRDRLKSIVLRADVGIVQQAWESREEQRVRVRDLQRERAREEQNLNDELREVLDDAGGQQ